MNRERAETFLRLLAEAELRGSAPAALRPADAPPLTLPIALTRVTWALTAVGALDLQTAEDILSDVELARAVRHPPDLPEAGVARPAGQAWAAGWTGPHPGAARFARLRPAVRLGPVLPRAEAGQQRHGPGRYVPVGCMILFHDETISGELDLMSYAHTASGARFTATWRTRDPLGPRHHGLPPLDAFTVADDRGGHYHLVFRTKGRPEATCDLTLRPEPPADIRWLEVTAPGEQAVRVDLEPPDGHPAPQVSNLSLSGGEQLLNRVAERLLTLAAEFAQDLRLQLTSVTPGPLINLAVGLGITIAALEAAEAMSPLSPVPGQLAALCASLRVRGHGITAAPAPDLPEPWLSMLSHYHRRKPDTPPAGDGFAAAATVLPELDGLSLVLLGLHNYDGATWMDTLAVGQLPDRRQGVLGLDLAFPLSIWVRSAGRWHVARPSGWHDDGGEAALTLRLVPPLTRSPAWIEVLAAGRSAEVRATVPLRWGCSS